MCISDENRLVSATSPFMRGRSLSCPGDIRNPSYATLLRLSLELEWGIRFDDGGVERQD